MLYALEDKNAEVQYKMYLIPLSAEGGFYGGMSRVLDRLPYNNVADYLDYLNWLPSYAVWLEDHIDLMKEGVQLGIVAPKVVINNNISLLKPWLPDSYMGSIFYKPFLQMPQGISPEEAEVLRQKAQAVISYEVLPVYKKLDNFLRTEYLNASPDMPGSYVSTRRKGIL